MAATTHMSGHAPGPDIALIHKLTNINDVNRLLHETLAKERSIDADLDRLLSKRAELERSFLLLNAPTVEMLELVHADCEHLLSSASGTAELATYISSKVRCLDSAQTAVTSVLSKINLILDCSAAIAGVKTAMDAEDYEAAAQHIATFTELDARLAAGHHSHGISDEVSPDAGQADNQRQTPDGSDACARPHIRPNMEDVRATGDAQQLLSIMERTPQDAMQHIRSGDFAGLWAHLKDTGWEILMDAKQKLEVVVNRQFDDAVSRRDLASAVRFARLYKPLGKQAEGLRRFIDLLQLVVGAQLRVHVTGMSEQADQGKKLDWGAVLSLVFKDVAVALESHESFVRDTFGVPAVLELVEGLQVECDKAGGRVISRFMEVRRVGQLVKEASSRRGKTGGGVGLSAGGGGADGGLDHRALEVAINELLALCRVTEEYNQFMLNSMRQAAGGSLTAARENTFRSGALNVSVRELLAHYMSLEEMYMYETANMAIRIDEISSSSLTSSMIDDVFFILRKCGTRVLASGGVQVMCALLMELNNVAANPLRNALAQRLAPGPTKLLAAAPALGSEDVEVSSEVVGDLTRLPAGAAEYAVALNNCDVAAEYMAKLKGELEGYLADVFPAHTGSAADRERVRGVLQELHRTAGELRQAASKAVEQLAEGLLPRLRQALDEAAAANYHQGETEYSSVEGGLGVGWVTSLVIRLRSSTAWLMPLLTTPNYEGCIGAVLDKLVSRLEALLCRKTFTQLGGLALERDLRALVGHVSDLTQRTIRDKFARLNQMALVLGLESVDELRDYWGGDSAITWRLSAAEIKAVMAQRPDFSRDALNMLQLV